jgi:hypothetical protein
LRREGTAKQPENFGAIISKYLMITMHVARLARFRWSRSKQLKFCDPSYGHNASDRSQAVGRKNWLFIGSLRAKVPECELDVACSQRAEDGPRCREVLRERPNPHSSKDGQDPGVVPRSVDRSASARRCESTVSKSDAIRPIWPSCKQHGVGYEQGSARANSTSEDPCSQRCVPMRLLGSADRASLLAATCVCGTSLATTLLAPQGYKPQHPSRASNGPWAYQQA